MPDEKVPKGNIFSINCPACKFKIKVDEFTQTTSDDGQAKYSKEYRENLVDTSTLIKTTDYEDEEELLSLDENEKIALVLDEPRKDVWSRMLEGQGYKTQFAMSAEHAIYKMRFVLFSLIIMNEDYQEIPLEENLAFKYLQTLTMTTRRKMFVVLVGDKFHSTNHMQAFSYSVNLVLNPKDIEKAPELIKRSINENEMFYKVFKENMTAQGKV
ncbi:MAG: hypothetical protein ACE5EK_08525 [Nitrospinales bacterium]